MATLAHPYLDLAGMEALRHVRLRPRGEAEGTFAGPRATQHLVTAAKASALLDGRPTPEISDLNRIAGPVLRHRIIPNYNALGEGIESDAIVKHLLETARPPAGGR